MDLYENSGYPQPQFAAWTSPVLPYGNHSVEIYQLGIDPRFGYVSSHLWNSRLLEIDWIGVIGRILTSSAKRG